MSAITKPPIFGTGLQSRDFTYVAATRGLSPQGTVPEVAVQGSVPASQGEARGLSPKGTVPLPELKGSVPVSQGTDPSPSTIAHRPSTIDHRPSTIDHRPIFHAIFNVANGHDHTVLELVALLNKIIGKNIGPKFLPVRPGDAFKTLADIDTIKNALGFSPSVTIEEGLRLTTNFWGANL